MRSRRAAPGWGSGRRSGRRSGRSGHPRRSSLATRHPRRGALSRRALCRGQVLPDGARHEAWPFPAAESLGVGVGRSCLVDEEPRFLRQLVTGKVSRTTGADAVELTTMQAFRAEGERAGVWRQKPPRCRHLTGWSWRAHSLLWSSVAPFVSAGFGSGDGARSLGGESSRVRS